MFWQVVSIGSDIPEKLNGLKSPMNKFIVADRLVGDLTLLQRRRRAKLLKKGLRVALYSHDTLGLGHMRRNHLIARALARSALEANVLMIAGSYVAGEFSMPRGVDCLTLPAVSKKMDGSYDSRSLGLPLKELISLRAEAICGALRMFQPDVLIVDGVPKGLNGELEVSLRYLRRKGRTHCVLGLRDILDEPAALQKEWVKRGNLDCVEKYYDSVWVYGDPRVFDSIREYDFPTEVAKKISYTGYFDRRGLAALADKSMENPLEGLDLPAGRMVLCMAGGGQDGAHLMEAFSQARLPPGTNGILLTGPYMPESVRKTLEARTAQNSRFRVLEFHPEPTMLLKHADRVVAMGGYNTVSEILSFEKKALIVPRVIPRTEQLIRAERLKEQGFLDFCHPDDLNPGSITRWLSSDTVQSPRAHEKIDLNGLSNLPVLLKKVLAA